MNTLKTAIWLSFVIIILCVCSWYFASSKPIMRLDEKSLLNTIDATATELEIKQFNKEGILINRILASKMTHIPNQNQNFLIKPHIISLQKDGTRLDIQANRAISVFGGKEITLTDDVTINHQKDTQTSILKTSSIKYNPKNKIAETDQPVTIKQEDNTITANGLYANLNENKVELLGNAKATYIPQNG